MTYKKFDNLINNIKSIKLQDFLDYEVIIQDDGSPNFDLEYVRNCCNGLKNLQINHNEKNLGTVKNYNEAIKISRGKYIIPLSQDDTFHDNTTLGSIVECLETNNYYILLGLSEGSKSKRIIPSSYDVCLLKENDNKSLWIRSAYANFISGSTLYFRKSFLIEQGLFDEEFLLIEDYPFVMGLLNSNIQIPIFDKITINYGEDGVTGSYYNPSDKIIKDNVKIYKKYIVPNISKLESNFNKDVIRWRLYRWEHIKSKHKTNFRFAHVLLWLSLVKFLSKIRKEEFSKLCNELMIKYEKRQMKKRK